MYGMAYLPTFAMKINYSCRKIYHPMGYVGVGVSEKHLPPSKDLRPSLVSTMCQDASCRAQAKQQLIQWWFSKTRQPFLGAAIEQGSFFCYPPKQCTYHEGKSLKILIDLYCLIFPKQNGNLMIPVKTRWILAFLLVKIGCLWLKRVQ